MKMRALDSFYSSETKQVAAGQVFEIDSDERGKEFSRRGLAVAVETPEEKQAEHPENKMQEAPSNKAAPAKSDKK